MAYKLRNREVFKVTVKNKEYVFTCYTQDTSYGFRHICCDEYNNTTECRLIKNAIVAKCSYYNRTWERFEYETVLAQAIKKSVKKEHYQEVYDVLIDKKAQKNSEECEKFLASFEKTWNSLSDKNKDHVKNGLGDNLITTQEQAEGVLGVMKMMSAFQMLEEMAK